MCGSIRSATRSKCSASPALVTPAPGNRTLSGWLIGTSRTCISSLSVGVVAVLHHLDHPFLGHAEVPLRQAGLSLDERSTAVGDPLPEPGSFDGLLVMGGMQSVVGGVGELAGEAELIRRSVEDGVPVLGVCLGAQLLARAFGGDVHHGGRSIEWRELEPLPAAAGDPVFGDLPTPVPALHWNEDVFDPPEQAVELLSRAGEGAEAFRIGDAAWGVQYHPDVDEAVLDAWYERYIDYLGP